VNFKTTIPRNNYDRVNLLENVKCFKYLGSMLGDHGSVLVKLNPGLPWQKLHLRRRKIFLPAIGLKFEEETSEMLSLKLGSLWC